ncbi:hypothetical protein CALVIDRAFT_543094 [Calocera viscosa TUFC12733]|uniref:Uncharacterized protein n=1 Tax=Calocera viscosa (strain TUFC12733) TaxID=1330018 RepID=A0A167FXI9_CALVF|nr:hypothetical protein CALVIDRAFT_543094 [Calocera viscosa TUFC12733]
MVIWDKEEDKAELCACRTCHMEPRSHMPYSECAPAAGLKATLCKNHSRGRP